MNSLVVTMRAIDRNLRLTGRTRYVQGRLHRNPPPEIRYCAARIWFRGKSLEEILAINQWIFRS